MKQMGFKIPGLLNKMFITSYKHTRNMISSGDAQTLVNHFMHLQSEDSNFFYSFKIDEDACCATSFG
ncbi:hypothetical protein RND71_026566 [Anisodus tanguticus]|uniref:Uncharacterized protein n=1 Tax=Anisodus tanguticus TaxID=243964 RepID=A0AAE1RNL8_9SOLA|nr:hypothetical protein RND71_026566 [Anisodus tanguticus]